MNILFIPHAPNMKVINRVYEFAKNSNSYYLYWSMDNSSLYKKIVSQISSLRFDIDGKKIQIPLFFKPERSRAKVNTIILNLLIKRLKIDVVVNANALLFDIKSIDVPVIYDLVDDHLSINEDIGLNSQRVQKVKEDIKNSSGVICVSEILEEKLRDLKLHQNIVTIENGLYIERFKRARSLKKSLGIEGKKIFGYIGGVDEWTGIDKACEAYLKIKNETNMMIVVGDSNRAFFKDLKQKYADDILFVGSIAPKDVANYFKSIDIGLIPFKLNDFTNNAFPIKALEYALGGAMVLSTPLKLLEHKKFPFIQFSPIEGFDKAMQSIKKESYSFDFEAYSWQRKSQRVVDFIKSCL
ncbi:Glycosyltransferase [hydrothermal vent metagenome]|uniref:Glycosyltransferase n=1 Tax=hydrothermal vent metagenome TaxID=652676 RepID=A0A1W1BND3_9ZZZZ